MNLPPDILDKISRYCAYRERSEKEVVAKLRDLGVADEQIAPAITFLKEEGFVNDARFARTFVRGRHELKKWGRRQLTAHLKMKGIQDDLIDDALSQIRETDYEAKAEALARKKLGSVKGDPQQVKVRLLRFLSSKGYESSICYKVVDKVIKAEGK